MFRGASSLSLDDKGRFAVPTKYRESLLSEDQGTVICTVALNEPCLWLYPLAEWLEIESRLAKISNMNPRARRMQRMLLGNATEYQLDKNGRILLAPSLRAHASLGKKIMLVTPENSAAATPAVTISCPVKNKFLMGVLGFKNSCLNLLGL